MTDTVSAPKIILISGTGRSGTNILKKIFGTHPAVAALPFEYRFIIDPNGIIDFYNSAKHSWSPFLFDAKLRALQNFLRGLSKKNSVKSLADKVIKSANPKELKMTTSSYSQWELNKWLPGFEEESEKLINALADFKYRGAWPGAKSYSSNNKINFGRFNKPLEEPIRKYLYKLIGEYLKRSGRTVFVEDNTWNILYAEELSAILPESKLIHIYRDPRDVIASLMKQRWAPSSAAEAAVFYRSIVDKWHVQKAKIPNSFFVELRFEDLIRKTEDSLKKLCGFVDLELDAEMLGVDLSKANIGRWKSDLNKEEQETISRTLSDSEYQTYFFEN